MDRSRLAQPAVRAQGPARIQPRGNALHPDRPHDPAGQPAGGTGAVAIRAGIPSRLHGAAARLYWRGFGAALQPLPTGPRQGAALVCAAMRPERALIALDARGGLVGLAGLRGAEGGFLEPAGADFRAVFGPAGGALRRALIGLYRGGSPTDDLILDGVAVRPRWRGRGVARALVAAAEAEARRRGHPALLAEVEARNRAALASWLALGFQPACRQHLGWPWHPRAHVLRRPVGPP